MRTLMRITAILILLAALAGGLFPQTSASSASWQDKVDPWVLTTAAEGETEFLVFLSQQADLSQAAALKTKLEKGTYVYETLSALAERTQGPVLAELQHLGIEHRSYWVANMIWVRGSMDVVEAMAQRADVAHLYANPWVKLQEPSIDESTTIESPSAIEWNIVKVNADDVWALGYNGQGTVIGGQDTGYKWDHAALINQYRGWEGGVADHNYNWHDAIQSGNGGVCGLDSPVPCDDHGHGTHTMGTMVGDDGGNNQVGMAPGARWIGCRNMDVGWGSPETYIDCYEWFIAPTDLNDENPEPSMAPDVINNSWGCPEAEGCTDPEVLLEVVQNVRAAGILTAHSAGNSGSGCYSIDTPAAIYDESYTVGATDSGDNIAGFSSRGTVTVDGSNRLKPDISAPGVNIRSSTRDGGYQGGWSGTSMAGPHVAGLVSLLISANPSLAGNVDALEEIINLSALPRTSTQDCGGYDGDNIPNPTFGWGRIDALAAVQAHQFHLSNQVSSQYIEPGGTLTYTLSITHTHATDPTFNVVLTDAIPTDTIFVSASEPYTLTGGIVRWDFPSLEAGESKEVSLVVESLPEATGDIINGRYSVFSDEAPAIWGLPLSTQVVPFDLNIYKYAPAYTYPGSVLTYTLTVTNPHPVADLSGVVLTDSLPANTVFIDATEPYSISDDLITWSLPLLEPGEMWVNELAVQVPMTFTGTVSNEFYGARADQVGTHLGSPVFTQVIPFDLSVNKSALAVTPPGSILTYSLQVTNPHTFAALSGVVLTDSIPANTAFVSATEPYTLSGGVITWTLPSLGAGELWSRELAVQVPMTFTGTIANQFYGARADQVDARLGEPVLTQIYALQVDKTASAGHVLPGDLLTYTLNVTNLHPLSTTHSLVLSDTLPVHTEFVSASGTFTLTGDSVLWELPELGPDETWGEQLVVRVTSSARGLISNEDYAAWSMEVPTAIAGEPVWTTAGYRFSIPIVFNGP